jgi:hypothetical protein
MTKLSLFILTFLVVACNSPTSEEGTTQKVERNFNASEHLILGEENARNQLHEAISGKGQPFTWDTLIKTSFTAIAIVEPILFDIFGREQILEEKPYEVYHIDGYWYFSGTLPKKSKGGTFEIMLSSRNGEIIRLTHYK